MMGEGNGVVTGGEGWIKREFSKTGKSNSMFVCLRE